MSDTDRDLTRREMALLRFAAVHTMRGTPFAALKLATWEAFGVGVLRYRQQLAAVLELPAAERAEPAAVRRLRAELDRRARRRWSG